MYIYSAVHVSCIVSQDYDKCITVVLAAAAFGQQCPYAGQPVHVGDPPGEGVITFGIILPLRDPTPDGGCGPPTLTGLATMEANVWAIMNARAMYADTGPKIGQ
mgnify:CR=1 FL=1